MFEKRLLKLTAISLLAIFLMFSVTAYAADAVKPDAEKGDPGVSTKDVQGVIDFAARLLKYFSAVGGVVVVGSLMYNGYKLASPNPKSRADAMQGFLYTTIGGIVSFGAYYFAGVLKGIAETL